MRNLLLILVLANISFAVFSQTNSSINVSVTGQVVDSLTSETVPYATMRITQPETPNEVTKVAATDDNGKFSFTMNKKGDYLLTIQFLGKRNLVIPFEVDADKKKIDMGKLLMADDSEMLGEVVVTAQKPLVKVDIDKITYSMEDDPDSKTNNVLDMLRKVPMITVDGEDNVELKGSKNFKIYLNGKPSNMITSNPKDVLRSMPANTIKDIEVITDPGVKYDAEGVAGIINIITDKQSSMVGYTATINSRVDSDGGYGLGGYLSTKIGKFGFTGNYNYYEYKQPFATSKRETTYLDQSFAGNRLSQVGEQKYTGSGQYGSGELSYEIDTLNLITAAFNRYHGNGKGKSRNSEVWLSDQNDNDIYRYKTYMGYGYGYGSTEFNADYQRTFSVKDRLLTASYKLLIGPDDSDNYTSIDEVFNYKSSREKQFTDAETKEHTFQIDFTTPINKMHSVETGVKYIIRLNESNSAYDTLNMVTDEWIRKELTFRDKFKHRQDILAAYAGYSLKWKKFAFKTGLRYEYTDFEVKYPIESDHNYTGDYSNIVPSATVTYQLNQMQNLRLGYNMRISRPSIWQLNPYENTSDPNNIWSGNPDLDAVKAHSINMNYSLFNPKLNININSSYNFENNSIEDIRTVIGEGLTYRKPENIGKNKRFYLGGYFNWTPSSKIRINGNMSTSYIDIRTNNERNLKNHGFQSNISGGIQYTLPKSLRLNVYAGYYDPWIGLQYKGSSFHYHSFSIAKGFLQDKLNLNLSVQNPFKKDNTFTNKNFSDSFEMISDFTRRMRRVNFSVSFRFGEMKAQIKKAQRGINNDDSMGKGGGGQGGQGGGQ